MRTITQIKEELVERVNAKHGKCTVAYLNMLLAGSHSCSYRMALELGELTDSEPTVWCDAAKIRTRRAVFNLYVEAQNER